MVTSAPGSARPTKVGVVSLLVPPSATGPVTPGASSSAWYTCTPALRVSTVRLTGALAGLSLPAASLAVTVMAWAPSRSGSLGVTLQLPLPSTTALAIGVPLSYTVMRSPGVPPLPLKVGVASSVLWPLLIAPVCAPWSSVTVAAAGALGAALSITTG